MVTVLAYSLKNVVTMVQIIPMAEMLKNVVAMAEIIIPKKHGGY